MTREGLLHEDIKKRIDRVDEAVDERLAEHGLYVQNADASFFLQDDGEINDSAVTWWSTPTDLEYGDMSITDTLEADDLDDEAVDTYLNAELIFDI